MADFLNRTSELRKIKSFWGKGGLGYVTGRRRVGKTALLAHLCREGAGLYHQAVEGTSQQQIQHIVDEWRDRLPLLKEIQPKTWQEFFSLLSREALPKLLVFDEFPYWVQGDATLPSLLQKWIDHELPRKKTFVCVSGSSQSMLYAEFLNEGSPLYGRSLLHLHLEPLSYSWFCRALRYPLGDPLSFTRFSLVGGVPHYWKLMPKGALIRQAEALYFDPSAPLAEEPRIIAQDEGIAGTLPKAILDLVGRGVSKPSEMAARLGTVQGNLSRPFSLLQEVGLIQKELPYGESQRTTKKVVYSIQDAALSFYYRIHLPYRARWPLLSPQEKMESIQLHASNQWEIFCRKATLGSSRYWEGDVEIDLIAPLPGRKSTLVAECKWSCLSKSEESGLLSDLKFRFSKTKLARKIRNPEFKILSQKDLPHLIPASRRTALATARKGS